MTKEQRLQRLLQQYIVPKDAANQLQIQYSDGLQLERLQQHQRGLSSPHKGATTTHMSRAQVPSFSHS